MLRPRAIPAAAILLVCTSVAGVAESGRSSGAPAPSPTAAASPGAQSTSGGPVQPSSLPVTPYEFAAAPTPAGRIDELVFARFAALNITPAHVCSDAVFVRRVYLDVIGTLPTADEVRRFLADRTPDKRRVLIDALLARDEFADYWTMKWCDLLRVKAEFPINLWPNAAQAYHRWIYTAIRDNLPYDQFARTLLTASGSNFRVGPVNFYRAVSSRDPQAIARAVALTFLGSRLEKWPTAEATAFTHFFSAVGFKATQEWKEEIVFFDPTKVAAGKMTPLVSSLASSLFQTAASALTGDRDPRLVFADLLIRPDNALFTRPIANRVWFWLVGRGIVHEPDDFRPDNPPSHPELLDYLSSRLVTARFDLKQLMREILNSRTYQLSSLARTDTAFSEANFASYPLRRLDAEVLIDALDQITGTTESYSSAIPEPFTFIPEDQRSIALPDGSISSSFLEMFGRPGRDTGQELERNNRISATQRLHLLNSSHVQRKLAQGPRMQALLRARKSPRDILTDLYLTILSRPPTEAERAIVSDYAASGDRRTVALDVAWALINSPEFLYKH